MTLRDVLLPLFVEVILTFVLLFWMADCVRWTCAAAARLSSWGAIVLAIMWGSYILDVGVGL